MELLTADQAHALLKPHEAHLYQAVASSFEEATRLLSISSASGFGPFYSKTTRATMRWDFMRNTARKLFRDAPGVRIVDLRQGDGVGSGLFYLVFNERLAVRFKKLDDEMRPRNYRTRRQKRHVNQELNDSLLGGVKMTNAEVGYRSDDSGIRLLSVNVACWRGSKREWVLFLGSAGATTAFEQQPILPAAPTAPSALPVRVRASGDDVQAASG